MAWDKKWNENRKKKRAERKAIGLCIQCGEPSSGLILCDRCNEKKVETQQEKRALRKKRGVCSCGAELAEGKNRCEKCYQRKRRANELLFYGEIRVCQNEGCDNIPAYKTPYCIDCIAAFKSSSVYFYNCNECGNLFTAQHMAKHKLYCSDKCARQSQMVNPIDRTCTMCGEVYELSRGINHDSVCSKKCQKEKNRNFKREHKRRRKALLKNAKVTKFSDYEIFIRDGYKCHLCGAKLNPRQKVPHPKAPTIDHVIPISCGGNHTRRNVKCACFMCNALKGNRTIDGGEQLLLFGT